MVGHAKALRFLGTAPWPGLAKLVARRGSPRPGARDARDAVEWNVRSLHSTQSLATGARSGCRRLPPPARARAPSRAHRKRHRRDGGDVFGVGGVSRRVSRRVLRNDVGGGRGSGRAIRARDPRLVGAPRASPWGRPRRTRRAPLPEKPPARRRARARRRRRRPRPRRFRRGMSCRNRRGLDAARDAVLGRGDAPVEVHQRRRHSAEAAAAQRGAPTAAAHTQRLRGGPPIISPERLARAPPPGGGGGLGAARGRAAQVARLARERGFGGTRPSSNERPRRRTALPPSRRVRRRGRSTPPP